MHALPAGRLRQLRLAKGWTQTRWSEESGIDVATISRYEKGDSTPNVDTLDRLARALGLDLADFVRHEQPRPTVTPPFLELLGARIRARRTAAHLSVSQLALQAEVDARSISRFESGEMSPTLPTLARLANALRLELAELLTLDRPDPLSRLSPLEQDFLSHWRRLSARDRSVVSSLVRLLERSEEA